MHNTGAVVGAERATATEAGEAWVGEGEAAAAAAAVEGAEAGAMAGPVRQGG